MSKFCPHCGVAITNEKSGTCGACGKVLPTISEHINKEAVEEATVKNALNEKYAPLNSESKNEFNYLLWFGLIIVVAVALFVPVSTGNGIYTGRGWVELRHIEPVWAWISIYLISGIAILNFSTLAREKINPSVVKLFEFNSNIIHIPVFYLIYTEIERLKFFISQLASSLATTITPLISIVAFIYFASLLNKDKLRTLQNSKFFAYGILAGILFVVLIPSGKLVPISYIVFSLYVAYLIVTNKSASKKILPNISWFYLGYMAGSSLGSISYILLKHPSLGLFYHPNNFVLIVLITLFYFNTKLITNEESENINKEKAEKEKAKLINIASQVKDAASKATKDLKDEPEKINEARKATASETDELKSESKVDTTKAITQSFSSKSIWYKKGIWIVLILFSIITAVAIEIFGSDKNSSVHSKENETSETSTVTNELDKLRLSAEKGDAQAQFNLALMHENGQGVVQDYAQAMSWYKLAAAQGHAKAQLNLAFMYAVGQGVVQDYAQAMSWYKAAAAQGHATAQLHLGVMYGDGLGVVQDSAESVKWYKLAAEQGHAKAQLNLAFMYDVGQGVVQDYAQAMSWYKLAAEQGDAIAQYNLALMYDNGQGVVQDHAEAVKWHKLAAEQGHAKAQLNLALMHENGQGVVQDYAQAVKWYKLAAEQGYAIAQYNLALMYDNGQGVVQDHAEAVKWHKLAAEQGNATAQYAIGVKYNNGQGVVQDYVRAQMWWNLAAINGNAMAVKNRDIIAAKMTPQQISEAQKLATECQVRNFKNCD